MPSYEPGRSKTLFFGLNPKGAKFLKALNLWVRCRRRFFFSAKKAPIFLQALSFWVRCRRRLFFSAKKGPIFFGTDPPDLGTDHEGTARKYLARHGIMRARHGNIWHGTDPPDLGTARHGTSLLSGRAAHSLGTACQGPLDILPSGSAATRNEVFMGSLLAVWLTCGRKALPLTENGMWPESPSATQRNKREVAI